MLNLTAKEIAAIKPLVVLLGPTAIGKSRVAIQVAKAMQYGGADGRFPSGLPWDGHWD